MPIQPPGRPFSRTPVLLAAALWSLVLPASGSLAAEKAKAPPAEPIYDTLTPGEQAIEGAAKTAAESRRRLLINFGTNDCAPCRVVNDAIYDEKFRPHFFEQFVPVFVDVTPGSKNAEILKKYGIDPARGLPAIAFSDKDGKITEVSRPGELATVAKQGSDAVQVWLTKRFLGREENSR